MDGPFDQRAMRRNVRRLILVTVGLAVVGMGTGVLVAAVQDDRTGRRHHPNWALLAGISVGVLLAMVAVALVTVMLMGRQSSFRGVMQYGWFERRAAYKAVKAGRPLDGRQVQVVRASLAYLERSGWTIWIWPALVLIWTFNALSHEGTTRWVMLGLAAAYAALVPFALWQRRLVIARYRAALR